MNIQIVVAYTPIYMILFEKNYFESHEVKIHLETSRYFWFELHAYGFLGYNLMPYFCLFITNSCLAGMFLEMKWGCLHERVLKHDFRHNTKEALFVFSIVGPNSTKCRVTSNTCFWHSFSMLFPMVYSVLLSMYFFNHFLIDQNYTIANHLLLFMW